jgi:hypothetical protein
MKTLSIVFAGLIGIAGLATISTSHAQQNALSVEAINQKKSALVGQTISAKGKVVKVNNGIMGRNFVHVQDGTGDAATNNLIVTSKQTAKVGDQVAVSGVVVLNRDFGSGYVYPLLIEDATLTPK